MYDDLDTLLAGLRDDALPALVGVEHAVWRKIRQRQRAHTALVGEFRRNAGIAAAALLIGVVVSVSRPVPQPKPVNISLLLTEVPQASLLQ
jgi:hypothetical protein